MLQIYVYFHTRRKDIWLMFNCDRTASTGYVTVGSLQLWVSFAKEPYKRDCILRETIFGDTTSDRIH